MSKNEGAQDIVVWCCNYGFLVVLGKNKMDKTFAFSYMKLMKDDGSIIPDGTHELFVYKVR